MLLEALFLPSGATDFGSFARFTWRLRHVPQQQPAQASGCQGFAVRAEAAARREPLRCDERLADLAGGDVDKMNARLFDIFGAYLEVPLEFVGDHLSGDRDPPTVGAENRVPRDRLLFPQNDRVGERSPLDVI